MPSTTENTYPEGATSPWYPTGYSEPCLTKVWAKVDAEADATWSLQHPEWEIKDEDARFIERLADDIVDREDGLMAAGRATWEELN